MIRKHVSRIAQLLVLLVTAGLLGGCEDPQVYGSIGVSSYGGGGYYGGGPRMGGSVSVGGRIF